MYCLTIMHPTTKDTDCGNYATYQLAIKAMIRLQKELESHARERVQWIFDGDDKIIGFKIRRVTVRIQESEISRLVVR